MPVSRQASKIRWSLVRACARMCNSFGRRVRRELEGRLSSKFVHAPLGAEILIAVHAATLRRKSRLLAQTHASRKDAAGVTREPPFPPPFTPFLSLSSPPLFDNRKRHHQTIFSIERVGQNSFATFVRFFFHRSRKLSSVKKTASFFFDRWCHPVEN